MSGPANPAEAQALCGDLLRRVRVLDAANPGEHVFRSIIAQLEYLEPFLALPGGTIPRKEELNFGFLAVRFVDEFDEGVSRDAAELSQYVKRTFS